MPKSLRKTPVTVSGDAEWSAEVTAQETAPTTTAHGIDCSGFERAGLALDMDTVTSFTCRIYVSPDDGATWVQSEEDKITESTSTTDLVRHYDVAAWTRIAVRITAISATSITRTLTLA